METMYAFIDEFGAFGYNFENEGCSSHFIITAILVEEYNVEILSNKIEKIRKTYFQTGEIKSSKIGKNHNRRCKLIEELKLLPFNIFVFVCDKRKIYENSGLRYKESFYKFLNNIVHQELELSFSNLIITADEMGTNDFIKSFAAYIRSKEKALDLFGNKQFQFKNSKDNLIIQLADLVSGSLAYDYDETKKKDAEGRSYKSILSQKILRIKEFPETFETFNIEQKQLNPDYNFEIASICYNKAKFFIQQNEKKDDIEIKQQIVVLNYLLFRFMNRSTRKYIPTQELIKQLESLGFGKPTTLFFRNKIIAKLRDNEVIISSSKNGYKIPCTERELFDFIEHGKGIIEPLLSRLKKCNDVIKLGTNGKINLFEMAEFHKISDLINAPFQPVKTPQ